MSPRRHKVRLGDVLELRVPEGLAYVQVITHDLGSGLAGVRAFREIQDRRPGDMNEVVAGDQLFAVEFPVAKAVQGGDMEVVANVAFGGDTEHERMIFRRNRVELAIRDRRSGRDQMVNQFADSDYLLPLGIIVTGWRLLADMIRTEYRDRQYEVDRITFGPKRVPLLSEGAPTPVPVTEFYLYLPSTRARAKAFDRLRADPAIVSIREANADNGLVVIARVGVDLGALEATLRAVAREVGGEFDGVGHTL